MDKQDMDESNDVACTNCVQFFKAHQEVEPGVCPACGVRALIWADEAHEYQIFKGVQNEFLGM